MTVPLTNAENGELNPRSPPRGRGARGTGPPSPCRGAVGATVRRCFFVQKAAAQARYSVWAWFAACGVMLVLRPGEWREFEPRVRLARLLWTLGLAMHAAHVLFAFGLAHRWSHAAAGHVAAAGGFGWAIAANYLFAAWLVDVLWWWADPTGHAGRPWWVGRAVHGFLAFVVFNAAVVFGPPVWQVVDAGLFGVLAVLWWWRT